MRDEGTNARRKRGFLFLGLLALTGCGDSADSLLRTSLNVISELTDRLMKVTDEESAKKFNEVYLRACQERFKDLDEKWQKWIKDIEDDFRSKKLRVISIESKGNPGSEQWQRDLDSAVKVDDARVTQTRAAFVAFLKNMSADEARFTRERTRLAALVKQLTAEKIGSDKLKSKAAKTVAKENWPNLVMLTEPESMGNVYLTGVKKQP